MTLSFCVLTKNSAAYIERLLQSARQFADEVVVAVDSSSADSTEEVCARYADKLFRVEPVGSLARGLAWLQQQCEGDWILRLDDGELPSKRLIAALTRLMQNPEITHYWLRRRWIFGGDQTRWISQHPWYPDWQMRLHRNIPSIFYVPAKVHTRTVVWGGADYVYEGAIYHLDLVYHSEEQRRQKVQQGYERRTPGKGLLHFYVPEEVSPTTATVPEDDAPVTAHSEIDWRQLLGEYVRRKSFLSRSSAREVTFADIYRASMQEYELESQLFKAQLKCEEGPWKMSVDEWYPVGVEVQNESSVVWPLSGLGAPVVRVGYHWLRADSDMHNFEGHRTDLPHTLRPGEAALFPASVRSPKEPGNYILQWDLIIEGVTWFSGKGWRGPAVDVRVGEARHS